jgi:hypothetical protein
VFDLPLTSLSFERIDYLGTVQQFWDSISRAIQTDIAGLRNDASGWSPAAPIISQQSFLDAFRAGDWQKHVVLLLDELSELHLASGEVRDSFLRALREAKNHASAYVIRSVIGAGTFSILRLNQQSTRAHLWRGTSCKSEPLELQQRLRRSGNPAG